MSVRNHEDYQHCTAPVEERAPLPSREVGQFSEEGEEDEMDEADMRGWLGHFVPVQRHDRKPLQLLLHTLERDIIKKV